MIPRFPGALFPILDGLGGAIADAGHAVGAAAAPDGLAVWQGDVVQRTSFDALAAAIAGIAHCKGRILYNDGVEEGVHRAAQKTVEQMLRGGPNAWDLAMAAMARSISGSAWATICRASSAWGAWKRAM